ncbi:MAG: hypothetical protein LC798_11815 [Chloroflexi bacterium]|nr:hypothetical protein [Chloroflexota bacterium]
MRSGVPSLRERIGAGILLVALVMLPVGLNSPDVGGVSALLAAVALFVISRTPAPEWAHAPGRTKVGVIVIAWGTLVLALDNMTQAGTPPVLLPAIIAAGFALAIVGAFGVERIVRSSTSLPFGTHAGNAEDPRGH